MFNSKPVVVVADELGLSSPDTVNAFGVHAART